MGFRSILILLVSLNALALVSSFTTTLGIPQRAALSYPVRQVHILKSSTTANGDKNPVHESVIKQFEQMEAKLDKQKAQVMEQLSKVEDSRSRLQSQKQDYLNGVTLTESPPGGVFSESTVRSAVKAFMWRIIAGSVTFVTSLRFSGSIKTALTIVGSDFFSKSFTMFIGERLMNKSKAGRGSGKDNASRSLVKALIWRLFAIANTLTMAIFISKDLSIASKIAGTDAVFKTALMFAYERVWAEIKWGKVYLVEFSI